MLIVDKSVAEQALKDVTTRAVVAMLMPRIYRSFKQRTLARSLSAALSQTANPTPPTGHLVP